MFSSGVWTVQNKPKSCKNCLSFWKWGTNQATINHYKIFKLKDLKNALEKLSRFWRKSFWTYSELMWNKKKKLYITSAEDSNIKLVQMILLESEQWVRRCTMISKKIACSLQPLNSTTQSNAKSRRCSVMLANPSRKKDTNYEAVKAKWNVLGKLLTLSANAQKLIDFEAALSFPLSHVPLSLAYPDRTKRSTKKSKLSETVLEGSRDPVDNHQQREVSALIIDMIAQCRVISTYLPQTFEE